MGFIYKFDPKHSLCTIKIHYHEHTCLSLPVHILGQMNSVQVTSEHSNTIWWKHKLCSSLICSSSWNSGIPRNFVQGGVSTNSVEDRENGDLGAEAP